MTRLSVVAAVLFVCASFVSADEKDEKAKEKQAELGGLALRDACENFKNNPANEKNTYPTILPELVKPPFGGTGYLRNGEKDLLDPWGKMFQYGVAKNEKGELRTYIWVERTVDGKTKVIGMKPPEPKKK